jgi:hypothetical protein
MLTAPAALLALLLGFSSPQEAPARQETQAQETKAQEQRQEAQEDQEAKKSGVDYSKRWDEILMVPDDVDLIQEKSLPYIPPNALGPEFYGSSEAPDFFGMRTFCVILKPKQSVKATLKATPLSRYQINFRSPNMSDPFLTKIRTEIKTQNARRMPFIQFKNTTTGPYPLVFFVIGYEDATYSVTLKRSK